MELIKKEFLKKLDLKLGLEIAKKIANDYSGNLENIDYGNLYWALMVSLQYIESLTKSEMEHFDANNKQ